MTDQNFPSAQEIALTLQNRAHQKELEARQKQMEEDELEQKILCKIKAAIDWQTKVVTSPANFRAVCNFDHENSLDLLFCNDWNFRQRIFRKLKTQGWDYSWSQNDILYIFYPPPKHWFIRFFLFLCSGIVFLISKLKWF